MPGALLSALYHLILFSFYTFCKACAYTVLQFVFLLRIVPGGFDALRDGGL